MKYLFLTLSQLFLIAFCFAQNNIKGHVADAYTNEPLIGANVKIANPIQSTLVGLDGSFNLKNVPNGNLRIQCSFIGYNSIDTTVNVSANSVINFKLKDASSELNVVTVIGKQNGETDAFARKSEREALNVMNVISAKTIMLSPDITVANVLQRVSGVSLERSGSGDGRYAIIRGMDKRYNYTLVNGVKIPSPDNKNRYVPLDIFPADLVECIEVSKTLTADMEGDAIGGVVNMVTKNAPDRLYIQGSVSSGHSQTLLERPYQEFSVSAIHQESPYQKNGASYSALPTDFTRDNLKYTPKSFDTNKYGIPIAIGKPNTIANFSLGNRFLDKKLGVMIGASYTNDFRGYSSIFNPTDGEYLDGGSFFLKHNNNREYSTELTRTGLSGKLDYKINTNNNLKFYSLYAVLDEAQTRLTVDTLLTLPRSNPGTGAIWYYGRSRFQRQTIYNGTLQGEHRLIPERLKFTWSGVYSIAKNKIPDLAEYEYDGGFYPEPGVVGAQPSTRPNIVQNFNRTWLRNEDSDLAGYANLIFTHQYYTVPYTFSVGGLYRAKSRDNYFDSYLLKPVSSQEWSGIDNFNWSVFNPSGSSSNGNNYNMTEDISAVYTQLKFTVKELETIIGIRAENTSQLFNRNVPVTEGQKTAEISYLDLLPSLAFKYILNSKTALRLSYFGSVSRPGYFELVPTPPNRDEDFTTSGNANLKHTTAQNLDFRYEYFPKSNEQILIGAFYKKLTDPIEYGFVPAERGTDVIYQPNNYGDATNFGFEFVYEKYIKDFGVRANYTYTNSSITTTKKKTDNVNGAPVTTYPEEKRSLQGQSKNIANVALLYKNLNIGLDMQLAWQFTGNRVALVSPFYGFDYHQRDLHQFDFSAEKKIGKNFAVFTKVKNILNAPYEVYVNKVPTNASNIPFLDFTGGKTLIQKDVYGQNYQLGFRYTL